MLNEDGTARDLIDGKYPAKVLNASHCDLDGVSSAIAVKNTFTDVTVTHMGYGYGISKFFKGLKEFPYKLNDYEIIIMTDLSMDVKLFSEFMQILGMAQYQGRFIFLDHHETSKPLHDPKNNIYVATEECGASLTKVYLENTFNVNLSHLDELIKYTKDYDLWVHKYKQSKHLNYILDKYLSGGVNSGCERFVNNYIDGFSYKNIGDIEKQIIIDKLESNKKIWDELEIIPYDNSKIGFTMIDGSFMNDISDKILKDKKLDIDVVINFYPNKVGGSIRASGNVKGINLGKFLGIIGSDLGISAGGHKLAAGFKVLALEYNMPVDKKIEITQPIMENLAKYLVKTYPDLNK